MLEGFGRWLISSVLGMAWASAFDLVLLAGAVAAIVGAIYGRRMYVMHLADREGVEVASAVGFPKHFPKGFAAHVTAQNSSARAILFTAATVEIPRGRASLEPEGTFRRTTPLHFMVGSGHSRTLTLYVLPSRHGWPPWRSPSRMRIRLDTDRSLSAHRKLRYVVNAPIDAAKARDA